MIGAITAGTQTAKLATPSVCLPDRRALPIEHLRAARGSVHRAGRRSGDPSGDDGSRR